MTTSFTIVTDWNCHFTIWFNRLGRIHWLLGHIRSRADICRVLFIRGLISLLVITPELNSRADICCVLFIRGLISLLVITPMCQEISICQISSFLSLQVFHLFFINECFHIEGYTAFEFFNQDKLSKLFKILVYFL